MYIKSNEDIEKFENILNLQRKVIGIRFIKYKSEFEESSYEIFKGKNRLCGFAALAAKGKKYKVKKENFSCPNGPTQVGISKSNEIESSGRLLANCGLYSDFSIAKEVSDSFARIPQEIYGLQIGPLNSMEEADIVVIIAMANQIMKVMEAYTYFYGICSNTQSVGNAAMCSDLISKPFMKNDINLSFLCCGARTSTVSNFGELGIGMPINIFTNVLETMI